jgi:predicted ATP-dependent serine protease
LKTKHRPWHQWPSGALAIWGTGGIGKTQIALEFAHKLWADGAEVVLWIASETSAEVARSFNEAARHLKLEESPESNTADKNRHLVLQWLQDTGRQLFRP